MRRIYFLLVGVLMLSACAPLPDWMPGAPFGPVSIDHSAARFNFAWELSGDQDVGPLQVFDNGHQTWLQFQPGQVLPAVFAADEQGERPLRYTRQDDFLVIDGVDAELIFRGGQRRARAVRQASDTNATKPEPVMQTEPDDAVQVFADESTAATLTNASFENMAAAPAWMFSLSYDDATLRHALQRWARQAGWTFEPEHWAVDVDIPVSAEADFGTVFEAAVQALLAATELSERPLQPCFYTNRVLRVVPFTQACDRGRGETP